MMERCVTFIFYLLCATGAYAGEDCTFHTNSPNCNKLRQIKKSIDETIDPCENKYGYACNNWELYHTGRQYNNTWDMLSYQMNEDVGWVMDSLEQEALPLRILNESYRYYKSCLLAKGTNSLLGYLEIIKPGNGLEWPLLQELEAHKRGDLNYSVDDWPAEKFDIFSLLGELRNYALDSVFLKLILYRHQSGYIRAEVLQSTWHRTHNKDPIVSLLKEFGLSHESALNYAERIMATEAYAFSGHEFTIPGQTLVYGELKRRFPYLQKYLENINIHRFEENDKIVIDEQHLTFLLNQQWSAVEKRNICNYLMVKLLMHLRENGVTDFTKQQCVKELRRQLELPVNVLYYGYIYKPDELHSNADIQNLFAKVRAYVWQSVEKSLPQVNATHFTEQIKTLLHQTTLNIGNIPKNLSPDYFDILFGDVPPLDPYNYASNHLQLLRHRGRLSLINLQRTHFVDDPQHDDTISPFYDAFSQEVILPFPFLQPLVYHHSLHPIFKWSMLGYEMGKAVLSSTIRTPYGKAIMNIFEKTHLESWMADVVYQGYISEHKGKLQPDFTNISWKKLFFLNVAQILCDKNVYKSPASSVKNKYMNWQGFEEAFQCTTQ